jgi:hypothetical protein
MTSDIRLNVFFIIELAFKHSKQLLSLLLEFTEGNPLNLIHEMFTVKQ